MEREEYLKPEIISDAIEIGVYGIYYENEDGIGPHNNGKRRRKNRKKD